MDADHAVIHFATTTQPLPRGPDGVHAALGRAGFVQAADRLRVGMFAGYQPLTVVTHPDLIPLDRFHETL